MIRVVLHVGMHVLLPGVVARLGFKAQWRRAWLIMLATMLVDLDHLWANPVFDPNRCSIGFHPLHTSPAIALYVLMLAVPGLRLVALGLLLHMGLDTLDCVLMQWF